MRNQEYDFVSVTKEMIETYVAEKHYQNYYKRKIKKNYNNSTLHNGNNSKANCDIYEIPEGRFPLTI